NSNQVAAFENVGWDEARVDGIDGRFVWDATDTAGGTPAVINGWESDGFEPTDLVLALGTNNTIWKTSGTWASEFSSIRSAITSQLPSVERIYWVNVVASPGYNAGGADGSVGQNTVASWNSYLSSNLQAGETILDWNAFVKSDLSSNTYWDPDAIHMSTAGATARVNWLANSVP